MVREKLKNVVANMAKLKTKNKINANVVGACIARPQKTNKNGITLIALVITIIILLILAGVTINATIGDNGIFNKVKHAAKQTEIENIKEQIQAEILSVQIAKQGNISETELKAILQKYGKINYETDETTIKGITTKQKGYEILLKDIYSGTVKKIANEPDISGFNKEKTFYVEWNLNEAKTEYIQNEVNMKEVEDKDKSIPNNWYDYTEGVNHWANVKTTGGGNDCYWVWIPRYAYQVPDRKSGGETINIKFLSGTTNTPIDGSSITISNNTTKGSWNVHPAFWWDKDNDGVEDEGEQLTGIWVAKFEASSSSATDLTNLTTEQITTAIANDGGSETDTDLQVRVKPNVTSWRRINVNNIFTVCQNLKEPDNSLCGTNNTKNTALDPHMMKNTEWGAVAYLSRSVYGKNGEVWNNPYYNNTTNYSPITGLCSNETNGKDKGITDITKTCRYNEVGGSNASTTGNVYGVYDMAGGVWEYTAAIYKVGSSDDNRSELWKDSNARYVNQYTETTGSQEAYYGNINKYGDAVYETSSSGASDTGSWDASYSGFPNSSYLVFIRGGRAHVGSSAGVFAFDSGTGEADSNCSFRPVVLSSQL